MPFIHCSGIDTSSLPFTQVPVKDKNDNTSSTSESVTGKLYLLMNIVCKRMFLSSHSTRFSLPVTFQVEYMVSSSTQAP